MNQSYGARPNNNGSRHMPGLTEPEHRVNWSKDFPDTYEIRAWESWGDRGKVRALRKVAETYGRDPRLREHTVGVIRSAGVQPRDYRGMANAILKYAQSIYYINEPGEQVQSPLYTIRKGFGDCDDQAVLIGAMAESIALPWRFCLAGKGFGGKRVKWYEGGRMPWLGSFSHVYVQLGWPPFNPTTWMSAEPTIPGAPLGYDVVDHGVPEHMLDRADLGGRGGTPGRAGAAVGVPTGMNPRGGLAGYAGEIIGREGYAGAFGSTPWGRLGMTYADWCARYRPTKGFMGTEPNGAPTEAQAAAQAAQAAAKAAQAAADIAVRKPAPTFWGKIDWSEITAGIIQGVLVSATVAILVPMLTKRRS